MSTKHPSCFIIAEAGVNHNGSLSLAKKLVDAAADAKADAIKFQTFRAETLVTRSVEKVDYQKRNLPGDKDQYRMLKELELSFEEFAELKDYCDQKNILFLSTPFDEKSAKFLVKDLEMEYIKIPSGEVTNLPFLKQLAAFHKPLILSTGMSDLEEVERAVQFICRINKKLTLLHCTTSYPCPYDQVNLRAMQTLQETFNLPVGYSDHTMGMEVSLAALAMGASVIEKHFTLDRNMKGPDHGCSLEPNELKQLVSSVRNIEQSLGSVEKKPTPSEEVLKVKIRKSLVFIRNLPEGSVLTENDFVAKRAGAGIPPYELPKLVGKKLNISKKIDESITWKDVLGE